MVVTRRSMFAVLCACFFLSGATGLVYEVVWLRMLGVVFGHTVYAITTVLAAFMTGLGLGSYLFGRRAARLRNPVRVYGALEIGIGLYCALLPALLGLAAAVYLPLYRLLSVSYAAFGFVQFLLIAVLLVVPTTLMGGTLPVLAQAVVRGDRAIGRTVGALYAVNTFGAVVGVAGAGYGLLPALGNRTTLALAAAANVAVGLLALWYSRQRQAVALPPAPAAGPARAGGGRGKPAPVPAPAGAVGWERRLILVALGLSGAVSMVYEVAWTRGLALVIGSSTYAFSAMLIAFLVGIAGGAALYSWLWGAERATAATFAVLQAGIGLGVLGVLVSFDQLPELFLVALGRASARHAELVQLGVSAGALLAPTLLLGATFPCAVAACAPSAARAGEETGRLYAVNTAGAIGGAVLAGFVLVPALGVQSALKLGIVVNLVLAGALALSGPRPVRAGRWGLAGGALAGVALVFLAPAWDLQVMSSGPAIHAVSYLQQAKTSSLDAVLRTKPVLFYRDGPSATVSVTRAGQYVALRVNGKPDASSDPLDMQTQLTLGHLPLLLHPDPTSVLVIGLGSGITAGAVARHPIRQLDVVEIEPAVVEASRFFTRENGNVLKDPRVRLVLGDARNFLLTAPARYDIIISEPSNPWIGGIASLFSLESFQLARDHLRPGGLMAQWVQSYNLRPEDLKMIVQTFRRVFPDTSIWQVGSVDYLLLGRAEPAPVDLVLLKTRHQDNAALREDLTRTGVKDWPGVLSYFVLGGADAARFSDGAAVNTDDRLTLEFSAPRGLYLDTSLSNFRLLRSFRTAELPELTPESRRLMDRPQARYAIGVTDLWRRIWDDALVQFRRALELEPNYTAAMLGSGQASYGLGRPADALGFARTALAREPRNVDALYLAGLAAAALDDRAQALAYLQEASTLAPANEELRRALHGVSRGPGSDRTGR
jgi:spermidine synthase